MREALYFKNISFSVKLDSEADVSKYGQIRPPIGRPYPAGAGYDIRCNPNSHCSLSALRIVHPSKKKSAGYAAAAELVK